MSKPDAPASPDYRGAAEATAASQRVNYQSPWGSINWTPPAQTQPGGQPTMGGQTAPMSSMTDGRMGRLDAAGPGDPGDPGDGSTGGGPSGPSGGDPGGPGTGGGGPSDPPGTGMPGGGLPPPQSGPGSTSYNNMPWTQTLTLSPQQQQLLDAQNQTSLGMAGLQGQGLDAVRGVFNNMPSQSQLTPSAINPGQTAQDAIMSRLQPQLDRGRSRAENQLANQGIQVGSEAWRSAQSDLGNSENDAYMQAALRGIDLTQQARQQGMAEQGFYSQMPINLLNAVRSGSQVQTPQGGSGGPAANYLGAAQGQHQAALGQYGADVGAYNNNMASLATLAAAMMSDRRLKSNIERIGTHPRGFGLYRYEIFGEKREGVMADEVEKVIPEAVLTHPTGFKMVDYGKL